MDQLTEAETALHRYETVALQKLGRSSQKSRLFTLGSDAVMTIYSVLHKLEQRGAPGPMQVENAAQILRSSLFTGMDELMDDIFAPMPLLARDLSKTPPQVECRLPKLSVTAPAEEALRNIFLHLIRNALDHGIESAEERRAAGKPERGLLKLSAWSQDDHLGLRFSDDGRGLNLKHLRELAKAQRLLPDDQIASDEAVADLIFLAELSTAETVSDISGRGIGMAAVRSFIEALQGRIEIELMDDRASGFGYRSFVFVMTLPKELFPSADDGVAA
ncbi:MAG: ATP-binding protein [Pseudobdellovibrionaceae bacterium]|nr:ATP-binding protein [Pseudobdellovibrionaceae bacterium]